MNFKPMLSADASTADLTKLRYPLMISPKLDGIRCILWEGVAYSRNAKPIRNRFVQAWASKLHGLDGELIVGRATDPHCLNNTQSGVMSFDGEPDFTYYAFDSIGEGQEARPFKHRWSDIGNYCEEERVVQVPHEFVTGVAGLLLYEERCLTQGYEGVMLRDPQGRLKYGRATMREGSLMKLKRFQDGEATVTGLEEGSANENVAVRDALGRTKRSKDSAGLRPSGMVGTIIAVDPKWGELRIAPGTMTHADRVYHWKCFEQPGPFTLVGKTIHWRSFGYGVKDKPRFPRYYGIRSDK